MVSLEDDCQDSAARAPKFSSWLAHLSPHHRYTTSSHDRIPDSGRKASTCVSSAWLSAPTRSRSSLHSMPWLHHSNWGHATNQWRFPPPAPVCGTTYRPLQAGPLHQDVHLLSAYTKADRCGPRTCSRGLYTSQDLVPRHRRVSENYLGTLQHIVPALNCVPYILRTEVTIAQKASTCEKYITVKGLDISVVGSSPWLLAGADGTH